MPEQTQISENLVPFRTYQELLTCIYETAKSHRDSMSCYIVGHDIRLDSSNNINVVTIRDNNNVRNAAIINLLCQDGYAVSGQKGCWIIIHEKIIRDCEAEERNAKERKRQSRNEIIKWGLGYVIASILTIVGTLIVKRYFP